MRLVIAVAVLGLAFAGRASAQIAEMNGTWVLNGERSIGPHPQSETLVYHISEGEQRYTMDSVNENGNKGHSEWAVKYDGEDHPTSSGSGRSGGTATVSLKRLDAKTELAVNKRNGKITETYTRVLVDDDKTIMSIGRNADGKVTWVRVFEKQ